MGKTISTTHSSRDSWSKTHSETKHQSESKSQSETKRALDEELRDKILAGLKGYMTDEEVDAYAKNLLMPQLNAGLEAARQQYEAAELAGRQESENLAAALERDVKEQERAYGRSMADVQTASLARGMGRSSYTMQTLARQGEMLARAVESLRYENNRKQEQIGNQISLAVKQQAQTTGRLNADYTANLAAKVQELKNQQRQAYNQNYLAAINSSMGSVSTGAQQTTGSSTTDSETKSHSSGYSQTVTQRM